MIHVTHIFEQTPLFCLVSERVCRHFSNGVHREAFTLRDNTTHWLHHGLSFDDSLVCGVSFNLFGPGVFPEGTHSSTTPPPSEKNKMRRKSSPFQFQSLLISSVPAFRTCLCFLWKRENQNLLMIKEVGWFVSKNKRRSFPSLFHFPSQSQRRGSRTSWCSAVKGCCSYRLY